MSWFSPPLEDIEPAAESLLAGDCVARMRLDDPIAPRQGELHAAFHLPDTTTRRGGPFTTFAACQTQTTPKTAAVEPAAVEPDSVTAATRRKAPTFLDLIAAGLVTLTVSRTIGFLEILGEQAETQPTGRGLGFIEYRRILRGW